MAATSVLCAGCQSKITSKEFLNCAFCKLKYDLPCANLTEKRYSTMSIEQKNKWKCPGCRANQPKTDNSNTPLRPDLSPGKPKNRKDSPPLTDNITHRKKTLATHSASDETSFLNSQSVLTKDEIDKITFIKRINYNGQEGELLRHLICFKDWNSETVMKILCSAKNLKELFGDTHGKKMELLKCTKVMILEDHNEPILRMAVSKAVSMLGASDVHIVEKLDWEHDFNGRIYSEMADTIFVSSQTHGCMRRFAKHSLVPVVCMRSRRHASIQSLATIMSILEDYGDIKDLNIAYVGAPHQVLNDYLILCPMLGANLKFKCCCKKCAVSPLLLDDSKHICEKSSTKTVQLVNTSEALKNADIIIAGPTTTKKEKIPEFVLSVDEINKNTKKDWTFYHTFPRGEEVDDTLFFHEKSRTYNAFRNTQFIAAALIVFLVKARLF